MGADLMPHPNPLPQGEGKTIHCTFQEPSLMTHFLSQLENSGAFIERHIGPDAQQQQGRC